MSAESFAGDGEAGVVDRRTFDPTDPEVRSKVLSFLGYREYRDIVEGLEDTISWARENPAYRHPVTLVRWAKLPSTVWSRR